LHDRVRIPGAAKAASYGAWVVNPELERRPLVLLAGSREEAEEMRDHLLRVGIDAARGWIRSLDGLEPAVPEVVKPEDLDDLRRVLLLDVRNRTEYAEGHLPGAEQLSGGRILWNLDSLPAPDAGTILVYCQSGVRSCVAASALRRAGYDIAELEGGYAAWSALAGGASVPAAA